MGAAMGKGKKVKSGGGDGGASSSGGGSGQMSQQGGANQQGGVGNQAALDTSGLGSKQASMVGLMSPANQQDGLAFLSQVSSSPMKSEYKDLLHIGSQTDKKAPGEGDRRLAIRARLADFLAKHPQDLRGAQMLKSELLTKSKIDLDTELASGTDAVDQRFQGKFPMLPQAELDNATLKSFDPGKNEPASYQSSWDNVTTTSDQRAQAPRKGKGASKNLANMWKVDKGEAEWFVKGGSEREVAMEKGTRGVAEALGLQDHVLPVQTKRVNSAGQDQNYMMTPFMKGEDLKSVTGGPEKSRKTQQKRMGKHEALDASKLSDQRVTELYLMDFLMAQSDRNSGNVRIGEDGNVLAIDNESAMGTGKNEKKGVLGPMLKKGVPISGTGVGRTSRGNAFLDILLTRMGHDVSAMTEQDVAQALAGVPLPQGFSDRARDTKDGVSQMFTDEGIEPRYYQEGVALMERERAKDGGGSLGGLLTPDKHDAAPLMPAMGTDEANALMARLGAT